MSAVRYEVSEGIARVTLNRPEVLNALDLQLMGELHAVLDGAAADPSVPVVVLSGQGEGFCSGADLRGLPADASDRDDAAGGSSPPPDSGDWVARAMGDFYNPAVRRLTSMPVPTLARINGVTAGGGLGLALGCDISIAAYSASFVSPFGSRLGIVPDMGTSWQLPRLLGRARALGMALLGDRISARQAADWGLIWAAVPDAELDATVLETASRLRRSSGTALARTRQIMDEASSRSLDAQLDVELEEQRALIPRNRAGKVVPAGNRCGGSQN